MFSRRGRVGAMVMALVVMPAAIRAQSARDSANVRDSLWLAQRGDSGGLWVANADTALFRATFVPLGQPGHYTFIRAWVERADARLADEARQVAAANTRDSTWLMARWREHPAWVALDTVILSSAPIDSVRLRAWGRFQLIRYTLDSVQTALAASYAAYVTANPTVPPPPPAPRPSAPSTFQRVMQGVALAAQNVQRRQDSMAAMRKAHPPTVTGFLKSEVTTGMTKQCFYDVVGSVHTVTQAAASLCPLTASFPMP